MSYQNLLSYSLPFSVTFIILAEKLYIPLSNISIKFNLIIVAFLGLVLLINRGVYLNKYQVIFLVFFLLSVFQSSNLLTSLVSVFYFLISIIIIPALYYQFLKVWSNAVLPPVMDALIFHILISVFFAIYTGDRSGGLMYEPSYLSIALLPVLTWALYNIFRFHFSRRSFLYFIIFIIFLIVNKSAIGILVFGFSVLIAMILSRKKILWFLIFTSIGTSAVFAFENEGWRSSNDLLVNTLYNIVNSENLIDYVESRSGNRFLRAEIAYDVFKTEPLFGVGPWAYVEYVNENYSDHPMFSEFENQPATNVFLELLASSGILTGFSLLLILATSLVKSIKYSRQVKILGFAFVMMFVCMLFESNYLRPYWWLWYGILHGYMLSERNNSSM